MFPFAMGFGSPTEIAIIGGVILLLFGGSKIAGFGKSLGQGIKEFKQEVSDDDASPKSSASPLASSGSPSPKS